MYPFLILFSLASLFNAVEGAPAARHRAFLHVVRYADSVKRFDIIAPIFDRVDSWIAEWGINRDEVRSLISVRHNTGCLLLSFFQIAVVYSALADVQRDAGRATDEMRFLSKALMLYDESAVSQPAVRDLARRVALTAIRAPEIVQLDHLQDLAPVRALTQSTRSCSAFYLSVLLFAFAANSVSLHRVIDFGACVCVGDAALAELLAVFTKETFVGFRAFLERRPGVLAQLGMTVSHLHLSKDISDTCCAGLSQDECETKMRLLSLATLGADQKRVSYATIAQTLQIAEQEVEPWVIRAIRAKVLEAQMDQLGREVAVTYVRFAPFYRFSLLC